MRYATFEHDGRIRVGRLSADGRTLTRLALDDPRIDELGVALLAERTASGEGDPPDDGEIPLDAVRLLAPVPRPRRNVFCIGKNYHAHAAEFARSGFDSTAVAGRDSPDSPIVFSKVPECVIAPGAGIPIDASVSVAIDYEAELAVIIGRGGRCIPSERALEHVWGYTILNDVTARDLQARHGQWLIGKSQDGFCPMGPFATSPDALDLGDTRVRCRVDGETRQDANTRDLIFDVPTIIAAISNGVTLLPGDIIATGTPAGVGIGFDPPRYLRAGNRVDVEIDGIGTLSNPVVAHEG